MSKVLELCSDLPVKPVPGGDTLMSQGGTNPVMAVLKSGKVEVIKDGEPIVVVDEPGSVFGEMAVILRSSHTATVRALEFSEFYMIEKPYEFLWERAEFNFELLTILAKRLDEIDGRLAKAQKSENSASDGEEVS